MLLLYCSVYIEYILKNKEHLVKKMIETLQICLSGQHSVMKSAQIQRYNISDTAKCVLIYDGLSGFFEGAPQH